MYTLLATAIVLTFCLVTVVLPFRCPGRLLRRIGQWRSRIFGAAEASIIDPDEPLESRTSRLWRVWGAIAASIFAILGMADGAVVVNAPSAPGMTFAYGVLAMGGAGLALMSVQAYSSFFPRLRAFESLGRSGVRALWVVPPNKSNRKLAERLFERTQQTTMIGIVDVTGHEVLGKGPGAGGALLFDVLDHVRHVPVYVLLCKPDADTPDPERRLSSVFQNLLAEMNLSQSSYLRRLRVTLEAIDTLNENRPPEAKISVRYYTEKPTFRSIVFDDAVVAFPFEAREDRTIIPYLELGRNTSEASFFESFRRHFARIWGTPIEAPQQTAATSREQRVRSRLLQEKRALSGSFALRAAGDEEEMDISPVMTATPH